MTKIIQECDWCGIKEEMNHIPVGWRTLTLASEYGEIYKALVCDKCVYDTNIQSVPKNIFRQVLWKFKALNEREGK